MFKELYIGIDTGVSTGFSVWNPETRKFNDICTCKIHQAMKKIEMLSQTYKLHIRVEDARQRKWYGNSGREKLQGAGSVKRDSKIWEDFLKDNHYDFEMVAPARNKTKLTPELFAKITGYTKRTSEHGRDAAMLVFGY